VYTSHIFLEIRVVLPGEGLPADPQTLEMACLLIRGLGGEVLGESAYERNVLGGLSLRLGTGAYSDIVFHRQKKRIALEDIRLEECPGLCLYLRTAAGFEIGEETGVFLSSLHRLVQRLGLTPEIRCNAGVALAQYPESPASFVILPDLQPGLAPKAIDAELTRQEECCPCPGTAYTPATYVPAEGIPAFKAEPVHAQVPSGRLDPVCLLCMGGAISGRITAEGIMETGDERVLRELLARQADDWAPVQVESLPLGRMLSEEIIPGDWAILIEAVAGKINAGNSRGIVITHGTDTLPYTAPLLYWLFADAGVPIVLAASSTAPSQGGEAPAALRRAVQLARREEGGVYVVHGGKVLSPLNLKFERIGQDGFRNWNQDIPVFSGSGLLSGPMEADRYVLSQLLEDAVNSMCVVRIYPGLRADYLVSLMDQGVKNFFLELYDTGTAGFREGPYSLRRVITVGKRRGLRFYCSSQQEGMVDFSLYATSHEVWKEGAVPMGPYTTETAVARYLAASIIADSGEERANLMEGAAGE
jgi:L-asparaginase/Glu-tRNA(Gln) amidotransferase subunit D